MTILSVIQTMMTYLSDAYEHNKLMFIAGYVLILALVIALAVVNIYFLHKMDRHHQPFDYGKYLAQKTPFVDAHDGPNSLDNRKTVWSVIRKKICVERPFNKLLCNSNKQ